MPELPEVETITNALKPKLIGLSFTAVEIYFPKLRYDLTIHQIPEIIDQKIIDVRRRARYTIIELANHHAIIFHYGMTGAVRICTPNTTLKKHEHVAFILSNSCELRFEDPRRFGYIQHSILDHHGAEPHLFDQFGPEPFDLNFTAAYLAQKFSSKNTPIKTAIMDNQIVVGVGNIYANEALFLSKIHPTTPVKKLSVKQLQILITNVKAILAKAIEAGGTTISDFKGVDGQEGKFHLQLAIYGRDGQMCHICNSKIERIKQAGRATFLCPKCQKL
ncbi:MAG: bifunctional DNA-formamidopyrimidine glycosylase/DNA-(apurinic or apyrimidinic site) lyase [Lentisphaeria bacterium]